jgi:multiple sugar transport system permease protein
MDVSGGDVTPLALGRGRARRRVWTLHGWFERAFTAVAVLPTFAVMLCIFGIPLLFSLYLSFTGWAPGEALFSERFVGLENYQDLVTDPVFIGSLGITFCYTIATVAAQLALGLAIALLLNIDLPYMRVLRAALVIPMMITPIVGALCWKLLLEPSLGFVNYLIGQKIVWLGQPGTALAAVWVVGVWQNTPYVALILLAGRAAGGRRY